MQRAQPQTGVQLFTLRETGDGLPTMVAKLTALGYDGVELTASQLRGIEPGGLAAILADAGMVVSSAHVVAAPEGGLPESDLDALQTLGVDFVVLTFLPPTASSTPTPSPAPRRPSRPSPRRCVPAA
jgi:sugar phosphate isomerase/epimerase